MERRRRPWAWLVAVTVLLLGYQTVSHGIFVGRFFALDDFWVLHDVAELRGLADVFAPSHGWLQYRPLTTVAYFGVQQALFGLDPTRWQIVHLAAHALAALLVWAIARRLLRGDGPALACALFYTAAPGHTVAARWLAYFTMTGAALVVLLGVWLWLRVPPHRRGLAALATTGLGLLASEHAVVLPALLTLLALLVEPRDRCAASLRALRLPWLLVAAVTAAKLWWGHVVLPARHPVGASVFWQHYGLDFDPATTLESLGRYARVAATALWPWASEAPALRALGAIVLALATVLGALVLVRPASGRALRLLAFGVAAFVVGIAPVLFLPQHFASAYVGIGAFGLAVAAAAPLAALPGRLATAASLGVAFLVVAYEGRFVLPATILGPEIRGIEGSARDAAGWLRAIDAAAAGRADVREVVIPENWANHLTFDLGEAHRLFLCAPYRVRTVLAPASEPPRPWRAVVTSLGDRNGPPWPDRPCPAGPPAHMRNTP
ncbi:MAG: hypothetical protein KIT14_05880 [bacterium]|nr:hypothetical protein [bacterium]